jgi:uncharacterized protein YaaW (UPF0174 family)
MNMEFVQKPHLLTPVLMIADPEDLDVLVDYITDKGEGRLALESDVCNTLMRAKRSGAYSEDVRKLIAKEIRLFGGNSIANLFRGGDGVPYEELVQDVASHLKVPYAKSDSVPTIEAGILKTMLARSVEAMSAAERDALLKELNITNLTGAGSAATSAAITAMRMGGFGTYKLALVVANALAKAILGKGLSFAANRTLVKVLSIGTGPIGWVISGLWTVADLASPAYRVTVPCVIQVAYIRAKATTSFCPHCEAPNANDVKFCGQCGGSMSSKAA